LNINIFLLASLFNLGIGTQCQWLVASTFFCVTGIIITVTQKKVHALVNQYEVCIINASTVKVIIERKSLKGLLLRGQITQLWLFLIAV
jgi:hypothetical protein